MQKLKILYLYQFPLWGNGSGSYLRHLAKNLSKHHEVAILAPDRRRVNDNVKQYIVSPNFIPVFVGHPELQDSKKYRELSAKEIENFYHSFLDAAIRAVEDFKPDIIHAQHISIMSWVANFIYSIYNINFGIATHGSDLHNLDMDFRYFRLCKDAVDNAKFINAISYDTRDWFLKKFGKEYKYKSRVISGGVDVEFFKEGVDVSEIEKKYNLYGKRVVLFVGRLTPQKGIEYLIKAADKILGDIYIIGDGPERENLEKLSRNYPNVHILGYIGRTKFNELRQFYQRADVFVAPSIWDEPLGIVILEAMISRTPVVVTRKGGIPLAVKQGFNGFFVRPRSTREIAMAVNTLLENDELRRKMGENARKIVFKKFSWQKIANKFFRLYLKNLNNSKYRLSSTK